jgi:hypothetical protein
MCKNWVTVLEITVSFLGIHKWEPDNHIGFSPALHLQCAHCKVSLSFYEKFKKSLYFHNPQHCRWTYLLFYVVNATATKNMFYVHYK